MKKFTVILLWAALALPMMAQNAATTKRSQTTVTDKASIEQVAGKPLPAFDWTLKTAVGIKADAQVVYETSFENDTELAGWSVLDNDGDGNNWEEETYYAHTGSQSLTSRSYYGSALDPDNWLISPKVPLGGSVKFWAMNYMSSWPDAFAVYVCEGEAASIDDFVLISDAAVAPPASWQEYEFDLSAYAGKEGCIAIRHYDSYNQYRLFVDDFSVLAPASPVPQNVTVVPAATTADVSWENEGNVSWNLRYRPVNPKPETYWDFEEDTEDNTNIELTGGWTCIDADGDGNGWYHLNLSTLNNHSGSGHVTSASYANEALFPDNWLVSPKVKLDSSLSFWAAGQDPAWASEVFAVYVATGETADPTNTASFVKISDDITATGEMTEYTFDLSAYEGAEGYVAIRHYNVTDMFRLNIDDIMIGKWDGDAEWIIVEGINEMNYTITDLTPETTYEVQVQGNDEAKSWSNWSESVEFTTLAKDQDQEEIKFYVSGGFNGWNADSPLEITEEGATFDVVEDPEDVESKEFKILTAGENDWLWLGGIDENGAGYFEISEGMMTDGTEITLDTEGSNFRLPGSGNYTITLALEEEGNGKAPYAGVKIVVKQNNLTPTAVTDINSKTVAGVKYVNIAGMESNVPFDGVNIVVTTYTDGTKTAAKVIK